VSPLDDEVALPDPGDVALAVLRELPGTSTLLFDRRLRVILATGLTVSHYGVEAYCLHDRDLEVAVGVDRFELYEHLCQAALSGQSGSAEIWSAQQTACYAVHVSPFYDDEQQVVGGVIVSQEITARKRAEEALRHAQERFDRMFESAPVGVALITVEGRWVRVNPALLEITGYSAMELLAKNNDEITHPDDLAAEREQMRQLLAGTLSEYQADKRYIHARGHVISATVSVSLVRDRDGEPLHLIAQIQDTSERKLMHERLRYLVDRDPLTDLRNRRCLERELRLAVERAHQQEEFAALLLIDLDNFKLINEVHGHRVGDDLLRTIAMELGQRLRGQDLVARIGGDEFAILLPKTEQAAAQAVARDLAHVISGCGIDIANRRIGCTASIGAVGIGPSTVDDQAVLIAADRAMYQAKSGRARVFQFPRSDTREVGPAQ
jgi:diguanylate cyclase (GGDEF)-like protein/PAS domain S-box-containing protein